MKRFPSSLLLLFIICSYGQLHAQSGESYNNTADSLLKKHDYQQAMDSYTKAMPFYQDDHKFLSKLYDKRLKCERRLKLFTKAIADGAAALSLDSLNAVVYCDLAYTYGDMDDHKMSLENYTKAIPFYKANKNALSNLYTDRSWEYARLDRYKDAVADDSLAISLNPSNGTAYWRRGEAFSGMKDLKHAIDDFTSAMNFYMDDSESLSDLYGSRSNVEFRMKHYLKAINDASYAIKLNSAKGLPFLNRALAYYENGDYQLAIDDYTQAIARYGADSGTVALLYSGRGMCKRSLGLFDGAIIDYGTANKIEPNEKSYYLGLALTYSAKGDFQLGIDYYEKEMAYCQDDKNVLSSLYNDCAENAYFLKDYNSVINDCNKAISLNPSHVYPYYVLGKVYLKALNNKDLALQNFTKAMVSDTSKKSSSYIFSLFYTGKSDLAYKIMQDRLLSYTGGSQHSIDYYNMACLLSLMNRSAEANSYLKKALDMGHSKKYASLDEDFNNIKNTSEFKAMMNP